MFVCCECCVLSGRGLCDELITRPEESYRLWCVVVCDFEISRMRRPWPALGRSATETTTNKQTNNNNNIILPAAQWPWGRRKCTSNICWGVKAAGAWGWQNYTTFVCRLSWNLGASPCCNTRALSCTSTSPIYLLAGVWNIFVFIMCTKPRHTRFYQKHCECIENNSVNSAKHR